MHFKTIKIYVFADLTVSGSPPNYARPKYLKKKVFLFIKRVEELQW